MKEEQYLIVYMSGSKSLVNKRKLVELISANILNYENRFVYKHIFFLNEDLSFTLVEPVLTNTTNGFAIEFEDSQLDFITTKLFG